ncbi:hypothetical protein KY289_035813 [Solanum tuberosum]|nr:hypothetical protein KY289_035813 [Solanum tuberosum]
MSSAPNFIQQNNARPHIDVHDLEFMEAAQRDGFDTKLCFQLPNSPDLNDLDLEFFRAIQYQNSPSNVDELVECCMNKVMKDKGGNNYKERLEREGDLPLQVRCDVDTVNQALALLQQ